MKLFIENVSRGTGSITSRANEVSPQNNTISFRRHQAGRFINKVEANLTNLEDIAKKEVYLKAPVQKGINDIKYIDDGCGALAIAGVIERKSRTENVKCDGCGGMLVE